MNKVMLIGRLTRDPEVRYTQSGKTVASFSLAVDRRFARRDADSGQQTADFIPIVAWGKLAEICGNNLVKGRRISVEGRLQIRSYEAQDGTKRTRAEVVADEIEFLDSRNSSSGGGGGFSPAPQASAPQPDGDAGVFGPPIPDEEIPF